MLSQSISGEWAVRHEVVQKAYGLFLFVSDISRVWFRVFRCQRAFAVMGFAFIWLVLFSSGFAAENETIFVRRIPRIECEEPVFDFGEVPNTQKVRHRFKIVNAGNARLEIGRLKTTCGCTPAELEKHKLEPGESTFIDVDLSLKRAVGRQRKLIKVPSNDPACPLLELKIEGTALSGLFSRPSRLYMGSMMENTVLTKEAQVFSATNVFFSITNMVCDSTNLVASIECEEPGRKYLLKVSSLPPMPMGNSRASIMLYTDHEVFSVLEVPVILRVVPMLYVTPGVLQIVHRNDKPVSRVVVVKAYDGSDFNIVSVDVPGDEIGVSIRKMGDVGYRILISNMVLDESLNGSEIVIRTDVEKMPELRLPVTIVEE